MTIDAVVIGDKDYINFQIVELNGEIMIMMETAIRVQAEIVDALDHLPAQDLAVELALLDVHLDHALVRQ